MRLIVAICDWCKIESKADYADDIDYPEDWFRINGVDLCGECHEVRKAHILDGIELAKQKRILQRRDSITTK